MPREPISQTTLTLTRAILRYGEGRLAVELGMSPTEMCRKVNNQNGFTLLQLGEVIEIVGLALRNRSDETQVTISREEYESLKVLAGKYCALADKPNKPKPVEAPRLGVVEGKEAVP